MRLRDGRVLLGGGDGGTTAAELFDPDTDTFTPTGSMSSGRSMVTAHTLPDGRVMVVGGSSLSAGGINAPLDSIELFDPKTGTFSVAPYKLSVGRTWHASALVRDGTVLAMGGYTVTGQCDSSVGSVDQIDSNRRHGDAVRCPAERQEGHGVERRHAARRLHRRRGWRGVWRYPGLARNLLLARSSGPAVKPHGAKRLTTRSRGATICAASRR